MNPQSPGEELEIRITALLMGELSPDEAAALQTQIAGDAALTALHARLRRAVELLREASAIPEQPALQEPLRLSSGRRERLLAHFAGAKPAPVIVKPRRDWKWAVPFGLAASLIALLGGTVLVNGFSLRKYSAVETPDFAAEDGDGLADRGEFAGFTGEKRRDGSKLHDSVDELRFGDLPELLAAREISKTGNPAPDKDAPRYAYAAQPAMVRVYDTSKTTQKSQSNSGGGVGQDPNKPQADLTTQIAKMQAKTAELEAKNKELEIVKAELSTKTETLETRMKELDEKIAPLNAEVKKYKEGIIQEGLTGNENVAKTPPPPSAPGGGGGLYLPPASVEGLAPDTAISPSALARYGPACS